MNLRGKSRTEFPQSVRKAAFARACMPNGIPKCEAPGCGKVIRAGHLIFEHLQPDGLGGEPTMANIAVYCDVCADRKTFTEDNPRMQKADRVLKRSFGLMPAKKKIQTRGFAKRARTHAGRAPVKRAIAELTQKETQG
jgi:ribosomal protein L34